MAASLIVRPSASSPARSFRSRLVRRRTPRSLLQQAAQTAVELVRQKPDLGGVYRLLGLQISELEPSWKADADMMRGVIGRQLQKSLMYRCRNCHFKSQVFFWHCPACNKWETFTPNRIEV